MNDSKTDNIYHYGDNGLKYAFLVPMQSDRGLGMRFNLNMQVGVWNKQPLW